MADQRAADRRARADPGWPTTTRWTADLPADAARRRSPRRGARRPATLFVNDAGEIVLATIHGRQRRAADPAAARLRREPGRDLPRPRPGAVPPLPRGLPLARATASAPHAVVHLGKHGSMEWLPGKNAALSASCAHRRRDRQPAADLPVPGQRPRRGRAGQAARARDDRRPPDPADGPRRVVRRHRPSRAAARRARQHRGDGPGQAAGDPRRDLDADARRRDAPRPRARGAARRRGVRRLHPARRRLAVRDQGRPDPRRAARPRRGAGRRGPGQPGARDPARRAGLGRPVGRRARPARRAGAQGERRGRPGAVDAIEAQARDLVQRMEDAGWDPAAAAERCTTTPRCSGCCAFAATAGRAAAGAAPPTSSTPCCTRSTAASSRPARPARRCAGWSTCCRPAATSTPSTRGRSRRGWRGRPARRWPTRWCSATSTRPARYPESVGLSRVGHRARCAPPATTSPRCSRCSAYAPSGTRRRGA